MTDTQVKYNDYPLEEIVKQAQARIEATGCSCYQKFTCEKCNSRQTIDIANTFYTSGKCEECGHVTQITKCNYLLIL